MILHVDEKEVVVMVLIPCLFDTRLFIRWDPIGLRLFDVTSPRSQKVELVVGVLLTILTIGMVVLSKRFIKKTLKTD